LEKKTKVNMQQAGVRVTSCDYNNTVNKILVLGQSNGIFVILNIDDLSSVHSFQISENKIDSVSINSNGEWIALGSK
jgi:periodic tryptophan protein 2